MKQLHIFLLLLIIQSYVLATITWQGTTSSQSQNDSSIVNVNNEDLIIQGDVELPLGDIEIFAETQDVHVYFEGGPNPADTTIRANDNESVSGNGVLWLTVAAGRNIVFHINESNVRFRGTNLEPNLPLTIYAQGYDGGSGEIHFLFEEQNKTLQFTAKSNSGGCQFYIIESLFDGAPKVYFGMPHASNKVIVGRNNSLLGMFVDGLATATYDGFVFDGTGAAGDYATILLKPFGKIGLQTVNP